MSNQKHVKFFRRQFLIIPEFQIRFSLYITAISALAISCLYGANVYFYHLLKAEGIAIGLEPDDAYFALIEEHELFHTFLYSSVSIAVFLGLFVFGILFSHKIAGPIFNLTRYMDRKIEGSEDLKDVAFRKSDFFHRLAKTTNKLIQHYEKK